VKYEFIIVSSGAIAAAKQFVKLESKGKEIVVKQALASIQPHLMRIFHENFSDLGLLLHSVYCPILILREQSKKYRKYNQCLSRK
jgi:glutamate 5-kinase